MQEFNGVRMKIRNKVKIVLCFLLLLFQACSSSTKKETPSSGIIQFTDALGSSISLLSPKHVAVLSGSLADAWLLAGGTLQVITDDAKGVIPVDDSMVLAGSLKAPNLEVLIHEEVDFAILSAALAEHVAMKQNLEAMGVQTAYFEVETFEEYAEMMRIFTQITGREDLYQAHVKDVKLEIEKQTARQDGTAPTVLFLRAFATGVRAKDSASMTGQMLKDLGCINIADSDTKLLGELSLEAIVAEDPDFIFVTTMGESDQKTRDMISQHLTSHPAWSGLKAVQNGHFYLLPKELFHLKPNGRWNESYRILADYLYGSAS